MARQSYDPSQIEARWQKFWAENQTFRTPNPGDADFDAKKPKFYVLDMFPLPERAPVCTSGHPEGYTATDVIARMKAHAGFQRAPSRWGGMPSVCPRNGHAVREDRHAPRAEITEQATSTTFRTGRSSSLGFSYDWEREVNTSKVPTYYRWTQWIFAQAPRAGPRLHGRCPRQLVVRRAGHGAGQRGSQGRAQLAWRPATRVEKRLMRQWMLKITEYAERLLDDSRAELDWPESDQGDATQRGSARATARMCASPCRRFTKLELRPFFTTRPRHALFGATYMRASRPEHPLVAEITSSGAAGSDRGSVRGGSSPRQKSELARTELATRRRPVSSPAPTRINPVLDDENPRGRIPIWVADYVLMGYGTGRHHGGAGPGDQRDWDFANVFRSCRSPRSSTAASAPRRTAKPKRRLRARGPAPTSMARGNTASASTASASRATRARPSSSIDGMPKADAIARVNAWLEEKGRRHGQGPRTSLRDWLFSRQRYWGEPFPIVHTR